MPTFRALHYDYGCHNLVTKLEIPKIMVKVKEAERFTDMGRFGHLQNGRSSESIPHVSVECVADNLIVLMPQRAQQLGIAYGPIRHFSNFDLLL